MFHNFIEYLKQTLIYVKTFFLSFVVSIIFLTAGIIILASIISYNPNDLVETGGSLNYLGLSGANLAHILLQYFGFASYFLVIIFFRFAFLFFQERKIEYYKIKIVSIVLNIIAISFLISNIHSLENRFFNYVGGYIGYVISYNIKNEVLLVISIIISIFIIIICTIISLDIQKTSIWRKFCQAIFKKNIQIEEVNNEDYSSEKNHIEVKTQIENHKQLNLLKKSTISNADYVTQRLNSTLKYSTPVISLLNVNTAENSKKNSKNISLTPQIQKHLKKALLDFGIEAEIKGAKVGPVITMYQIEPRAGIRAARIIGLTEDIARSLKAKSARISLIPSSSCLAVEIPNTERETVFLRELIDSKEYKETTFKIPITLGKNVIGENVTVDLASMPHLLIAGTTGSGKSVGVNAMILSILYKLSPHECQFIMIDPKMLELSVYNEIPHLLTPVITDPEKAVMALKWLTLEMERRYKKMSHLSVRNIFSYNEEVKKLKSQNPNDTNISKMPFIVVVIDEMADLMITAGKTIEAYIQRLAQMARAAGIHVIMATQRPSVDVITGIIKANFPTRISYQVSSKIDSRTILGTSGAESLLGQGDMIYMKAGSKTYRVHSPFVSDSEVNNVVSFLKKSSGNLYNNIKVDIFEDVLQNEPESFSSEIGGQANSERNNQDKLYEEALNIVISENKPSISYIQRRLRIGYNKAANFIERMEQEGIISSLDSSTGKRIVIKNKS